MKTPRIIASMQCLILLIGLTLLLPGCGYKVRNKEMAKVAKDWSLVIRASQVIPVYPLTEDLQPGDVLLVNTPIEQQVKLYKANGFLPLDQLQVRLNPDEYAAFYRGRYESGGAAVPPAQWQKPTTTALHNWQAAPHAGFPTYQFSVDQSSGASLAIPVQGIPFALGLMNSFKASGSVTIADAYTYGLENAALYSRVKEWGGKNRELLKHYEPTAGADGKIHRQYLRVVSRVYAAGKVNVTLNNDEATSGGLTGGQDRPLDLFMVNKEATAENFKAASDALNIALDSQIPGGKVKVATATSRAVSLNETFEKPLVIGYLGFDLPILQGGRLGAPISTIDQLNGVQIEEPSSVVGEAQIASIAFMDQALRSLSGARAEQVRKELDRLGSALPDVFPFDLYEFDGQGKLTADATVKKGKPVEKADFAAVRNYLGLAGTTVTTLQQQRNIPGSVFGPALEANEAAARQTLLDVWKKLQADPAFVAAIDYTFLGI